MAGKVAGKTSGKGKDEANVPAPTDAVKASWGK